MITVSIKTSDGWKKVSGYPTPSKHFVVARARTGDYRFYQRRFVLSHVATGYAVAFANKAHPLRLMAAILGALPIPWSKIKSAKGLVKPWLALPIEIQNWRREFMDSL